MTRLLLTILTRLLICLIRFLLLYFTKTKHTQQTKPQSRTDENCLTDIELTVDYILPLLHSLNEHKATGPDGISNKILKETAEQVAPSLCLLFNLSLRSGSLPDDWKISNIVPVFKKGKRDHVSNYRQISLLSNISKVLERRVLVKTRDHLLQYVSDNQHGFIPAWSIMHNAVSTGLGVHWPTTRQRKTDRHNLLGHEQSI